MTPPSPASAISYTWDTNGDLTARGSDSFAWDYEDRMTSATVNSVTTTFACGGDGLRDSRTTGGNTTTFTWDIAGGLPVVLDDGAQDRGLCALLGVEMLAGYFIGGVFTAAEIEACIETGGLACGVLLTSQAVHTSIFKWLTTNTKNEIVKRGREAREREAALEGTSAWE